MSQHIVVIGGVALGPKAACRFKRVEPGSKVTMVDQSSLISYGGCGIPYYVSGDVSDARELCTTSFHMVRDAQFFKDVKGVDVRTLTKATGIDRDKKVVRLEDVTTGETSALEYDKLVIATGAAPRRLGLPGEDLTGVNCVCNPNDATTIRDAISRGEVGSAVIIGAGFIGLEMAEALADMWGVETSVVEITDQIMPRLVSPSLATMAQKHMEEGGVEFHFGEKVVAIEGEDGRVQRVITDKRVLEADAVIIAAGVVPNSDIAKDAGLEVHPRGGVVVDEFMRTSDPNVYSGGDCAIVRHLISNEPFFLPLGSMANRQGRVIGTNLAGGDARFDGVVGSFVVKLFEGSLAGTGLSLEGALASGFDAVSVTLVQMDREHFYPSKERMSLEMTVDRATRRVLGVQGFGSSGDAMVGRVNAVAAILKNEPTIDDVAELEMAYAPPFAATTDILNTLAGLADKVLHGLNDGVDADGFHELWDERSQGECHFVDCCNQSTAKEYIENNPQSWETIPEGRVSELSDDFPHEKPLVLVCSAGGRAYTAKVADS